MQTPEELTKLAVLGASLALAGAFAILSLYWKPSGE
jgi:hypothetical protein